MRKSASEPGPDAYSNMRSTLVNDPTKPGGGGVRMATSQAVNWVEAEIREHRDRPSTHSYEEQRPRSIRQDLGVKFHAKGREDGTGAFDAILKRDILLVQGGVVFVAACYVMFNIAVDVAQSLLDPRIKT